MKRIHLWLLVAIIVIGVGVYLAVTSFGPDRTQPEKKTPEPPEPEIAEASEEVPPAEVAPEQPTPEKADAAEAATKPGDEPKEPVVIGGIVIDEKKAPVAGAEVILLPAPYADATARTTRTDEVGRFRFENAPRAAAQLVLRRPPDAAPWCLGKVDPSTKTPEELANLEFPLKEGYTWAAITKDKDDKPIPGVSITLDSLNSNELSLEKSPKALSCTLRTDAQGGATFHALEPGQYGYTVHLEGLGTVRTRSFSCRGEPQKEPLAITLAPGGSIAGKVLEPDGEPATNATVRCYTQDYYRPSLDSPAGTAPCNDEGAFKLADLSEGRYFLAASSEKFSDGYLQHVRVLPGREQGDCTITLESAREIRGRVINTAKEPIEGATVKLSYSLRVRDRRWNWGSYSEHDIKIAEATSGADGSFCFEKAPVEHAEVSASKEGYKRFRPLEVVGDAPLTITLTLRPTVTGVVTVAETGKPVEKATVYCLSDNKKATTDAQGRYTFKNVSAGRQTFIAFTEGLASPSPVSATIEDEKTTALDFALEPSTRITGIVTDKATGDPIEKAGITIEEKQTSKRPSRRRRSSDELFPDAAPFTVSTDENGAFTIPAFYPQMKKLVVKKEDYLEERVDLENLNLAQPLRIELAQGVLIAGHVYAPDGTPLEDARVRCEMAQDRGDGKRPKERDYDASRERERTDEEGFFRIGGLRPGTYTLTVGHEDFISAEEGPLELGTGQTLEGLEIVLQEGGRISGVVTDENGTPIEDAMVLFKIEQEKDEPARSRSARHHYIRGYQVPESDGAVVTDYEGKYDSGPLPPKTFVVSARSATHLAADEQRIAVTAGATVPEVNFTLKAGAAVSGKILDEAGNPVREARVWLYTKSGHRKSQSEEDGAFVISGLVPGEVALNVTAEGYLEHEEECVAPADDVEIKLERGGTIVGRVVAKATQEPVEMFNVEIESEDHHYDYSPYYRSGSSSEHHPEGRFKQSGLYPGTCRVVIVADNFAPATVEDIAVEKGAESEEVLVELTEGATIAFTVTAALDARPVAGATVSCDEIRQEPQTTDEQGRCTVKNLVPGRYVFEVFHEEFAAKEHTVRLKEEETQKEITVALDQGLTLRGRVISKSDQTPIEGATVLLNEGGGNIWDDDDVDDADFYTQSGPDGTFVIECIAPGRYRLIVQHPDFAPFKEKKRLQKGFDDLLVIEMGAGGRIIGTVTDANGLPQPNVTVELVTFVYFAQEEVLTDEMGNYVIDRLAPGSYRIMAESPEFGEFWEEGGSTEIKRAIVRDGQDTRVDFALGGGAAVFGTITRAGQPVSNVHLMAMTKGASFLNLSGSWGSSATDDMGQYRIEGLPAGTYELYVAQRGDRQVTHREFTIGAEDCQLDIELGGGEISGVVYDELGQPHQGTKLTLMEETGEEDRMKTFFSLYMMFRGQGVTDVSGAFTLSDVAPGSYRLYVEEEGYVTQLLEIEKEADRELPPLQIKLRKEIAVAGSIQTEAGKLPERLFVAVCDEKNRMLAGDDVSVDPTTGEWHLGGLGTGRFLVTAKAPGYAPVTKKVTLSGEAGAKITLDLETGRDLVIAVVDRAGKPVPGAKAVLDAGGDFLVTAMLTYMSMYEEGYPEALSGTNADGTTTLAHIADGDYVVRVRCEGYEDASEKVRIAGSDKKVTITLKPGNVRSE